MDDDRWQRVKELFNEAIALPLAERTHLLDAACAGDQQLRHEVKSLLNAHDQANDFIEPSPSGAHLPGLQEAFGSLAVGQRIGATAWSKFSAKAEWGPFIWRLVRIIRSMPR